MNDYIIDYQNFLTVDKKLSSSTIESYIRDINGFKKFFYEKNSIDKRFYNCDKNEMNSYINFLYAKNKSEATVIRTLSSLNNFFKYLKNNNVVSFNIIDQIKIDKKEKKIPQILNESEIELILGLPNLNTQKGLRDKAMLELLYATGIKVSEIINLNVTDIKMKFKIVHCVNEKGERAIPIHKIAFDSLKQYTTTVRPKLICNKQEPALFLNMNGQPLTRQGFWKIIKNYVDVANISKTVTPNTLRHSFAAHLLENGASIKDLQEMLGHADISSTHIYSKIIKNKLNVSYTKYHPRANKF